MVVDTQEAAVPDQHHQPIENVNSRAQLTTTDIYLAFTTCLLWLLQREKLRSRYTCNVFVRSFFGALISICLLSGGFSCSSSDSEKEDQAIAETRQIAETDQQVEHAETRTEPSTEETSEPDDKEFEEQEEFDYTTGDSHIFSTRINFTP